MVLRNLITYGTVCGVAAFGGALFVDITGNRVPDGVDPTATGSILIADAAHTSTELPRLTEGLAALDDGKPDVALALLDTLPETSLDRRILAWAIARDANPAIPVAHIRSVIESHAGWPGMDGIRRNLERGLTRGAFNRLQLASLYTSGSPLTFQGAFALAGYRLSTGSTEAARQLLAPYWHEATLNNTDEMLVLERFADVLTDRDHEIRFFNMMVRERIAAGLRVAKASGREELHNVWSAVIRSSADAGKLLGTLTPEQAATAAGAYMRAEHLRRSGKTQEAAKLLNGLPTDVGWQINPEAWWNERRIVARDTLELGDAKTAYDLVSSHVGGERATRADAAFHAGWIALRWLKDDKAALTHFREMEDISRGAISTAKALYWQGRALEAAGTASLAEAAFAKAAEHSETFYGQIAAKELGRTGIKLHEPEPSDADRQRLRAREAWKAAERLGFAGRDDLANVIYSGLVDQAETPGEVALIAEKARTAGDHYSALRIAKKADWLGIDMGALTHPAGAIPEDTNLAATDRALAHSVARQESEFNTGAVSRADARGLLQLLPATAKAMSQKAGLAWAPEKLTTDPLYNAKLGTHYLAELLERFDGSYVLTFAGYNAGPSRAKEWIERFGDPRGKPLHEVIDWIELIPFPETRSYVQRILENLQVYKTRFGVTADIERDLRAGRAGSG